MMDGSAQRAVLLSPRAKPRSRSGLGDKAEPLHRIRKPLRRTEITLGHLHRPERLLCRPDGLECRRGTPGRRGVRKRVAFGVRSKSKGDGGFTRESRRQPLDHASSCAKAGTLDRRLRASCPRRCNGNSPTTRCDGELPWASLSSRRFHRENGARNCFRVAALRGAGDRGGVKR